MAGGFFRTVNGSPPDSLGFVMLPPAGMATAAAMATGAIMGQAKCLPG